MSTNGLESASSDGLPSVSSVGERVGRTGSRYQLDDAECTAIVTAYVAGMAIPDLARTFRHTNRTISKLLRDTGVLGTLQRRRDAARRGRPSPPRLEGPDLTCSAEDPAWAYIAGLFDGEGSIAARGLATATHRRYTIIIGQKDVTPLAWIQRTVGAGYIYRGTAGVHRYHLASQRAVYAFLHAVLPYLIVKGETALAARDALAASYGWEVAQ